MSEIMDAPLDVNAEENDWCTREEKVTRWAGEFCTSCGREWGFD